MPGRLPKFQVNPSLDLLFFGGKGGVGKSSTSAAVALLMASESDDRRILLISTDPAHSLGDCFCMKVGDEPTPVNNIPNLFVREIDAPKLMKTFIGKHEAQLGALALRGTYFDKEDVEGFLKLSLPGVDEVMALLEISSLLKEKRFDTVIVDTAPAGHTLAMLKLPKLLNRWIDLFDLMQSKHHILQEHFARRRVSDEVDEFLFEMKKDLTNFQKHLKDRDKTEFVVVMNPQSMSFKETKSFVKGLGQLKIPFGQIIVNRAYHAGEDGWDDQLADISETISKEFPKIGQVFVPVFPVPVRGPDLLKQYSSALMGCGTDATFRRQLDIAAVSPLRIHLEDMINPKARLLIVAGKGGVGKTTVAAATALRLASQNPQMRVHLLSIDPAHSLTDIFERSIGNRRTRIYDNLSAREIDSSELLEGFKERYREDIDNLFDGILSGRNSNVGIDLKYDRELLHSLIDLSPPGLDELMALHTIISLWDEPEEDVGCIVLDTAPTGHLIRFIEMPGLVSEWLRAIFGLLIKYKGVVQLGGVAERLIAISRQVRRIVAVLSDSNLTRMIVVSIPEAMVVDETERLIEALGKKSISVPFLVANMIVDRSKNGKDDEVSCARQLRRLHDIQSVHVVEVPLYGDEICGVKRIEEFGNMMFQ